MGILTKGQFTFGNKTKTQIIQLTTAQNLTGTAVIGLGSNIITGTGTLFLTELFVGDTIRFVTAGLTFIVSTISSNTSITVTTASPQTTTVQTLALANPKRIKPGQSVFNTTDRYPMYYSGDNIGGLNAWRKGEFCNGQVVPITNASATTTITEGQILQNSSTIIGTVQTFTSGATQSAIAVTYTPAYGSSCVPSAVCGIHNTDASPTSIGTTIAKGNFTRPSTVANGAVMFAGTTSAALNSGIAVTSVNTPVTGEIEMLVNFQERV